MGAGVNGGSPLSETRAGRPGPAASTSGSAASTSGGTVGEDAAVMPGDHAEPSAEGAALPERRRNRLRRGAGGLGSRAQTGALRGWARSPALAAPRWRTPGPPS